MALCSPRRQKVPKPGPGSSHDRPVSADQPIRLVPVAGGDQPAGPRHYQRRQVPRGLIFSDHDARPCQDRPQSARPTAETVDLVQSTSISPELADVLSAIMRRIRRAGPAVPLVVAYDKNERVWLPSVPLLFQRRIGAENRAIPPHTIHKILAAARPPVRLIET